ncbi:MAG: LuxR C-terminal-related transcriptional regulator [Deinococcales bacterium]
MRAQVLTIKLHAPPHRAELVPRSRLFERLDEGAQRKLTLVSAPAGFGKTTLVSAWLGARSPAAAWLTLDAADADPVRFLTYLVEALRTVEPGLGDEVLAALRSPRPPPTTWLVTEVLNDVTSLSRDTVLVLDDYHLLDARAVDEALTALLEHLPPRLHLVLTTRADPELRLARLRARGQLTELRARDLRFTAEETATFLNGLMGLELSHEDLAALEARTEGWIAGLQLAALSMRGRDDLPGFIRAFAGDHRYIVDYLVEEVLQRQPEPVRRFLLETSILERLSGPLCDAVTRGQGGEEMLHALERANLFLVPLDDRRLWYRYHPLFADVLQAHLGQERADDVRALHQRASVWYEADGSLSDAVHHALTGDDDERAARLIEGSWRSMDSTFQSAAWLAWVRALPEELVRARPVLGAGYAWALLNAGELEASEARLGEVERWLASVAPPAGPWPPADAEPPSVDEDALRSLPGTVASARAYLALATGDPARSVAHARRALGLLPASDHVGRGVPLGILALAHWANGDLDDAHRILSDAMEGLRAAGQAAAGISGVFALADIRLTQGRLRDARRIHEEALRFVAERPEPVLPGMAELHVGLAQVDREQGELEAADAHLREAEALGEHAVLPGDEARLRSAMARLEAGLGRSERALELLDEAERLRIRSPMPDLRPVPALRARVWLEQGRLEEAQAWMRERALPAWDGLGFVREFEHLVAARLLLALHRRDRSDAAIDEAERLLEGLLEAAEQGGRTGSAIEILVLQALARQARDDVPSALLPLADALGRAEPEGHVRTFVDEGPPMEALLREAVRRGVATGQAGRLLAAFGPAGGGSPATRSHASGSAATGSAATGSLVDALTEREQDVLRLLETELSGPEMARELRVSLNTVRTHVKNVYSKLGASNRRSAVRRARDLDLL